MLNFVQRVVAYVVSYVHIEEQSVLHGVRVCRIICFIFMVFYAVQDVVLCTVFYMVHCMLQCAMYFVVVCSSVFSAVCSCEIQSAIWCAVL